MAKRPRLETLVTVRLPSAQYDELARAALRRSISLPEVIRRIIRKDFKTRQAPK